MPGTNGDTPLDSDNVQHKLTLDTRTHALMYTALDPAELGPICMATQFAMAFSAQATKETGTQVFDDVVRSVAFPGYVLSEASSRSRLILPGSNSNVLFVEFIAWNSSSAVLNALANARAVKVAVIPLTTAIDSYNVDAFITIAAIP